MIVETYVNTLYDNPGNTTHRYWITDGLPIMVGGSLLGPEDWLHLRRDFGLTDVVNVETEHDDFGKLPSENLCQVRVPDDGTPFPAEAVLGVCLFAASKLYRSVPGGGPKFYVHCQMGGSRSPAFAYAIMRSAFGMSAADALAALRTVRGDDYGTKLYHISYLSSIESALAPVLGGR